MDAPECLANRGSHPMLEMRRLNFNQWSHLKCLSPFSFDTRWGVAGDKNGPRDFRQPYPFFTSFTAHVRTLDFFFV